MVLGLLMIGAVGCIGNYETINSNPYEPGDLGADDYQLGAAMNDIASCVVSNDINTTQFTECLLGGTQGGYFADSNQNWANTISNYNPTGNWTEVFMKAELVIPRLYTNMTIVKAVSEQTGNPVPYAIATVIKVAVMHRVADTYGPIPYSKIGADGSITTPYDSSKEVYYKFFEELNIAIAALSDNVASGLVESADYIYGGDVSKWIKFANSLKLRLAIRIANVDATMAKQMAEEAVSNTYGVIDTNGDNAGWDYFGAEQNPIYVAARYNLPVGCETGGDTHAAADIICYMNGYEDARRDKYFVQSEWMGEQQVPELIPFVGMRRGIEIPDNASVGRKYSGVKIGPADALQWMNAAEIAFLKAEAVAVYNFDMKGTAQEFYERGIRLSFEQWGAGDPASYLADNISTPQSYDDPSGENDYNGEFSTMTVMWDEGASVAEKQERIIIQKWIANWMLGNEAWADYRRTGYPKLIPATPSGNKSEGIVDSNRGTRRMPYPQDEYIGNTSNVNYAVSNYLTGPDDMGTDVWWAKKD